jgi:hypothetical protein
MVALPSFITPRMILAPTVLFLIKTTGINLDEYISILYTVR